MSFSEALILEIVAGFTTKPAALGVLLAFTKTDVAFLDESKLGFDARVLEMSKQKCDTSC